MFVAYYNGGDLTLTLNLMKECGSVLVTEAWGLAK